MLALLGIARADRDPIEERIAANQPVHHWQFPARELVTAGAVDKIPGPDSRLYPIFPDETRAMRFSPGSYLRHPATSEDPAYCFANGDAITIEAWVQCDQIGSGDNQYIIGKGRTHQNGLPKDNQNWALRLRGKEGRARLSFLFRSEDEEGNSGAYHRWTSQRGFRPGNRWHHLAVTYQFGDPSSIRSWVDGKISEGNWDLGGATGRPPVVDQSEVWIGSALGGSHANTLHGAVASIALYRHAVEGFEQAFTAIPNASRRKIAPAPPGRVSVEMFQADSGRKDWPEILDPPLRTLDAECFALFRLPPTYGETGERREQSGVYFIRLAANLQLPAGEHTLLLRAPGMARLTIGEVEVALLGPAHIVRDAHGTLRKRPERPYLRPRMGISEREVSYHSDGRAKTVLLEALVGDSGGKIQVGELLLAAKLGGASQWVLPSPGPAEILFTPLAVETYKQRERTHQDELNTSLRRELASRTAQDWKQRHDQARAFIKTLPPLREPQVESRSERASGSDNAIDRFLQAKINSAATRNAQPKSHFQSRVYPLLEEHCFRCHGRKKKGGLRLDSRPAVLAGGDSGPALVPHQPGESDLLTRVSSRDQDLRMPPKGERLTREQQASLKQWIEEGAPWEDPAVEVQMPEELDELAFLRRLYLDTVGVFPSPDEVRAYLSQSSPQKRAQLIDRLLTDPRHADHWVSYWQDVLAENPRLVKPTLNNTGPFRYWVHEALSDNKPFDRFVTELVTFTGGSYSGGAGGFRLATQNDVPMAAKAHVIGTAFLGLEMKCARCHDAPFHSLEQKDLFSIAAMLKGSALKVPKTSTVPKEFFARLHSRESRIKVTLDPNSPVKPAWPFPNLAPTLEADPSFPSSAEHLAYQLTRPENRRFARVIVNRIWKRYFGQGFVEPADDWDNNEPSHPDLLEYLARDFVTNNYDLHRLSRLILNSASYRRISISNPAKAASSRFFAAPLRRRLSAEQLVDSLFAATGTPLFAEELTLDVDGIYPNKNFLNMGRPRRAWEFISLSTERDRPSLTLPLAQSIVSFMEAYGWRSNRAEPLTDRTTEPNVLQAGMIANSLLATWWTRLSDHSELTRLAIDAQSPTELVDHLYLRLLTRKPSEIERKALLALLEPGFKSRLTKTTAQFEKALFVPEVRDISWRNHLNPEANQLAAENETKALHGPPPTEFLTPTWRHLLEDAVWAILNSPEMQFIP
jgi:hypothetical protein